ncbi:hypothetical protein MMC15_004988 [Xylographa vitiligo]|nr:hypothetical protein [Xylographa vitiligo]
MGHVVEDYDEALTFFERLCSAEAFYLSFKSFISENSLLTEDFIIKFVSRFGYSLRALSLKHIRIIFQGKWEPVIRQWRMDLPFLERISVVDLVEYNYGFVNLVTFPSLSDNRVVPGTDGINSLTYSLFVITHSPDKLVQFWKEATLATPEAMLDAVDTRYTM